MSEVSAESAFLEACENLGKEISALPADEKAVVLQLRTEVTNFAAQQEERGAYIDQTAFLASAIIFHPAINTESVVHAAAEVINKDYIFSKSQPD